MIGMRFQTVAPVRRRERRVLTPFTLRSVGEVTSGSGGVPRISPQAHPAARPDSTLSAPQAFTAAMYQASGLQARCPTLYTPGNSRISAPDPARRATSRRVTPAFRSSATFTTPCARPASRAMTRFTFLS